MPVISSDYFRLNNLTIQHGTNKPLDIKNFFRGMTISENIGNKFTICTVDIVDQYNLTETLPCDGNEIIRISWDAGNYTTVRDLNFFLNSIPKISKGNQQEIMSLKGISELFIPFIEKVNFRSYQNSITPSSMMTNLFNHYGISLTIEDTQTETKTYLPHRKDVIDTIDDIRFLSDSPGVLFQRDNAMVYSSYENLLAQSEYYILTNKSMTTGQTSFANSIKKIDLGDVMNRKIASERGMHGYTYFDIDIFEDQFNRTAISNSIPEFTFSNESENIMTLKSSSNVEDYIMSNYITAEMQIPISTPILGKLANLKLKKTEIDKRDFSSYSGIYLIYGVLHMIDENLNYKQKIQFVRKI